MKSRNSLALSVIALVLMLTSSPSESAGSTAVVSVSGEFRDCAECPQMMPVPAGTFQMGDRSSSARADEKPVHSVTLRAFAAGKYEVTRGEFAAFVAATGHKPRKGCITDRDQDGKWEYEPEATWRDTGFAETDRHPVVCVSWADATAYVEWLTKRTGKPYRLLSESEWEYAARAGTTTQYWWGDDANDLCAYANGPDRSAKAKFPRWTTATCDDGSPMDAPVGSYKANAFGLYDMAGNVWEWTQDCYEPSYEKQPRDGTAYTGGTCQRRTLRGGSWVYGLGDLRSTQRNALPPPDVRGGDIGFRVARSL